MDLRYRPIRDGGDLRSLGAYLLNERHRTYSLGWCVKKRYITEQRSSKSAPSFARAAF
jgi:hypothetical protein